MKLHKILKIVAALLGLAGVIFLVMIVAKGDDAIKAAALDGDSAIIDPMAYVTYIIFALTLAFVLFFVLQNLFVNTASLKSTLIGVGAFAAVLVISYVLSSGSDAVDYQYNGAPATEGEARLVGAGLISFYILIIGAAAAMMLSGIKKIIK
jgi:membrane protease YdiL (CAAX protease family)